jgi:hypothetical protein
VFKSLTDRGASGCKEFSMSLHNSQSSAAELFQQKEWQRSIPLSRTPSNKSEQLSIFRIPASSKTKSVSDSSSHGTLSEQPSPKGLLTDTLLSDPRRGKGSDVLRSGHYLAIGDIRGEVGFAFQQRGFLELK